MAGATGAAVSADLEQLYRSLPTLACRQRCQASCRDFPMLAVERDRLALPLLMADCPKLEPTGDCTVYPDRPLMCRLWGVVENMRCPYGCEPSRLLSVAEAQEVLLAGARLGGGWLNTPDEVPS